MRKMHILDADGVISQFREDPIRIVLQILSTNFAYI